MINPVKKILCKLRGHHYLQDYLCLANESFTSPLHCYIVSGKLILKDITNRYVFAGYSPVIFALPSSDDGKNPGKIDIAFCHKPVLLNGNFSSKDATAMLTMKKIKESTAGNIVYYEGINGKHHFVSGFHQFMESLYNRFYNKRPGNVFLKGNLYKQVQIAYSVPRNISLITVKNEVLFNLFPTDLHGPLRGDHYIISLRHEGKACRQVEETKKIIISEMDASAYKTVYGLGKNHMRELKQKENFPFGTQCSEILQLPIPEGALAYRELELQGSFMHGIHKLLLFKVIHSKPLVPVRTTLAHIHNSYATWRYNKHLSGNYLLR